MATRPGKVIDRDLGMKRARRAIKAMDGWRVTIGIHGEEGGRDDGEIDNVGLGVIHEFGAGDIPERSFLRSAWDQNVRRKYLPLLERESRKVVDGASTPKKALGLVGEVAVADVVNGINAGIPPPLKPATVARKGSTKPLIVSGQLKGSIKYKVEK